MVSYRPHNVPFVARGAGLLWFGWFGFNGGSEFKADAVAALAILNTVTASAAGMVSWLAVERVHTGRPTLVGASTGLVAGLVVGTPGAGFVEPWAALVMGLIVSAIAAFIFLGGVQRIAAVTEKVVPIMAAFYILGCIVILVINAKALPGALAQVFVLAFAPQAMAGGIAGVTVQQSMRFGVARGLFSNEAGLGSTPHAHALAKVERPQDQGAVAILGVFIDTFVVLTLTGLVLITSGLIPQGMTGTSLTQAAFSQAFGGFGPNFIAVCMFFFASSTIIGWYFFGQSNFKALFGEKLLPVYSIIVVACILVGSTLKVDLVWALADLFNGLMAVPNLLALLALAGVVVAIDRK